MLDRGGNPPADLRHLTEVVTDALVADAVESIDGPHLLICDEAETGLSTYSGPYASGLEALVAALHEQEALGATEGDRASYRFRVAQLAPPCAPPYDGGPFD
jgi:hypothetical protein